MGKRHTKEDVISRFIEVHGNKYDYSKMVYVGSANKISIICPKHGEFLQRVDHHKSGSGCKKCANDKLQLNRLDDRKLFIEKAKKAHGNIYDYSLVRYKKSGKKVKIICKLHGVFEQVAGSHVSGNGCFKCGRNLSSKQQIGSKEDFIDLVKKIHRCKYQYHLVRYRGVDKKVRIVCPLHGVFKQTPYNHKKGSGCPTCNKSPGWRKSNWIEYGKDKTLQLYVVKCHNENEVFFKVGITGNTIKKRFNSKSKMPYNYEILKVIKSKNAARLYDLECRLKKRLKNRKYKPHIKFSGHTECFTHIKINKK